MSQITQERFEKVEEIRRLEGERNELRDVERQYYDEQIEKAGLNYRYFRNNNVFKQNRTNINHEGVICIGYKIHKENYKGIVFSICVAFCSPKDAFSKRKAKEQLSTRYNNGDFVSFHIDYGSSKEIDSLIKNLWNGRKIPLEKLGINPIIPGKEICLKSWMRYIR